MHKHEINLINSLCQAGKNGLALEYAFDEFQTFEICMEAVNENQEAIYLIRNKLIKILLEIN